MPVTSASVAVPAGCGSVVVLGSFPASYQVMGSASWATAWDTSGKTPTQFVVAFTVPAPAVLGGTFDGIAGTLP